MNWGGLFGNAVFSLGGDKRSIADFLESGGSLWSPRSVGLSGRSDIHHIATNKDPFGARRFARLFKGAGMDLEDALNTIAVEGHQGPHGLYNLIVLNRLRSAVRGLRPGTPAYQTEFVRELNLLRSDVVRPGAGGLYDLLTSPASVYERTWAKLAALGRI